MTSDPDDDGDGEAGSGDDLPEDAPDDERPDQPVEGSPGGLIGAVRDVLEAIADADREGSESFRAGGRLPGGTVRTEYGVSGRIGLPDGRPGVPTGGSDRTTAGSDDGSSTTPGDAGIEGAEYRVDTRYDEDADELVVVADLPDVDHEDLRAAVDTEREELVIQVDDRTLDRLDLPWPAERVEGRFRHGILELRFEPLEE